MKKESFKAKKRSLKKTQARTNAINSSRSFPRGGNRL